MAAVPRSNDLAIRKWQSVGLEWLIRRLIWAVASLRPVLALAALVE
jgi:hypothetical protein